MKANSSTTAGVDGYRYDTGLDRAEKSGRKVDRVVEAEEDTLLGMDSQSPHEIGKPAHPFGEFHVTAAAAIVDEGCFRAPPGGEIPLDEISSGIVCSRALAAHRPFSLVSGLGHYISICPVKQRSSPGDHPRKQSRMSRSRRGLVDVQRRCRHRRHKLPKLRLVSHLLDEVERGETFIITRHGRAIARIIPEAHRRRRDRRGARRYQGIGKEIGRKHGPVSVEEIISSIHEGYKY
jgi:prevent-host-death family protein